MICIRHNYTLYILNDTSACSDTDSVRQTSQYFSCLCSRISQRDRFRTPIAGSASSFKILNICLILFIIFVILILLSTFSFPHIFYYNACPFEKLSLYDIKRPFKKLSHFLKGLFYCLYILQFYKCNTLSLISCVRP